MGKYLNPGNDAFHQVVNDDIYVDASQWQPICLPCIIAAVEILLEAK